MRAVQSLLAEPHAEDPPVRVWRDWLLLGALVPAVIVEAIVREDLVFPVASAVLGIAMAIASLWRRTHPLFVLTATFSAVIAMDIVAMIVVGRPVLLYSGAVVLTFIYSLFRWGSGRDAAIGLGVMALAMLDSQLFDYSGVGDAVAGAFILLATAEFGWLVRTQFSNRAQRREQIRLHEREQLARELHDTVAHRVSAIAISAQAGRVLAQTSPSRVTSSFAMIEEEASRALSEMRAIVGRLREEDLGYSPPEFTPGPGLTEIEALANKATPDTPRVDVAMSGDLADLGPSIEATAFRLVQESVTNAIRHATNATRVEVSVTGEPDGVRVTVSDDGDSPTPPDADSGYGVIGMAERAALVGGTFAAGPGPVRGWRVEAVLPRGASR
ncbi:MAG: sensor histidine kinase [Iamia sp.]